MTELLARPSSVLFSCHGVCSAELSVDMTDNVALPVRGNVVLLEPYTVFNGWPADIGDTTVVARSSVSIKGSTGSAYPEAPSSLGHDVLARWIGGTDDLAGNVWSPQEGDPMLTLRAPTSAQMPIPYAGYRYKLGAGFVSVGAMVFTGSQWMQLTTPTPWAAAEMTIAVVGVLRNGLGSTYRLLAAPERDTDDETPTAQVVLDYDHGVLMCYTTDIRQLAQDVPYDGTPVAMVLRMKSDSVALSVLFDQTLSTITAAVQDSPGVIDANLYFGRGAVLTDNTRLFVGAVFEIAVWGSYLPDEEVRSVLDIYDSSYGLTR